ncbi:hypothetical protein Ctob_008810 [Chrysochromulina tobinii]|uniref:Uncharacterized protein n=1 Tax=Chrysochromulina tobinii TaxID=1460289 RepID=A0A0M0JPR3_9EUKA|nr:hypothetical protein Ctob_008810 [Chrysochromulina tobinii]|eukprot:KOO28485.1 hypothetical protein Ctob_008810 [Chrysochromulina sp. CCMP291]
MMSTRSSGSSTPSPFLGESTAVSCFMMRLGGSPVAPLTLPDLKTASTSSIHTTDGASALATLKTVCTMSYAFLPGYLPSVLLGVRLNRLAPVSLHTALTSIFLPVPGAPTMSTGVPHLGLGVPSLEPIVDMLRGAWFLTACEPMGSTQNSVTAPTTCAIDGSGSFVESASASLSRAAPRNSNEPIMSLRWTLSTFWQMPSKTSCR